MGLAVQELTEERPVMTGRAALDRKELVTGVIVIVSELDRARFLEEFAHRAQVLGKGGGKLGIDLLSVFVRVFDQPHLVVQFALDKTLGQIEGGTAGMDSLELKEPDASTGRLWRRKH